MYGKVPNRLLSCSGTHLPRNAWTDGNMKDWVRPWMIRMAITPLEPKFAAISGMKKPDSELQKRVPAKNHLAPKTVAKYPAAI